jgi:hypothetical protein
VNFACDNPEKLFPALNTPVLLFTYLAELTGRFVQDGKYECARCLFSALAQIGLELGEASFTEIACDGPVFYGLLNAARALVHAQLRGRDARVALLKAVLCVRVFARHLRRPRWSEESQKFREAARANLRLHRETSRSIFRAVAKQGWPQPLTIDIFPAFWPGAMDYVFPVVFKEPITAPLPGSGSGAGSPAPAVVADLDKLDVEHYPAVPKAAHTILQVLKLWESRNPSRLIRFVAENRVLEQLREHGLGNYVANPFPFRLALLLACGTYKLKPQPPPPDEDSPPPTEQDPPRKRSFVLSREREREWDKHNEWVASELSPLRVPLNRGWKEAANHIKPRKTRL